MKQEEILKRINDWYAETNVKKEDWIKLKEKFDEPRVRAKRCLRRLRSLKL